MQITIHYPPEFCKTIADAKRRRIAIVCAEDAQKRAKNTLKRWINYQHPDGKEIVRHYLGKYAQASFKLKRLKTRLQQ